MGHRVRRLAVVVLAAVFSGLFGVSAMAGTTNAAASNGTSARVRVGRTPRRPAGSTETGGLAAAIRLTVVIGLKPKTRRIS
jgi:hypothetical protein